MLNASDTIGVQNSAKTLTVAVDSVQYSTETTGMNTIFSFLRFRNGRGSGKKKGSGEINTRVDKVEDISPARDTEFDLKGIYGNRNLG